MSDALIKLAEIEHAGAVADRLAAAAAQLYWNDCLRRDVSVNRRDDESAARMEMRKAEAAFIAAVERAQFWAQLMGGLDAMRVGDGASELVARGPAPEPPPPPPFRRR